MGITVTVGTNDLPEITHYEPKDKDMYINEESGKYWVFSDKDGWLCKGCLKGVNIIEPQTKIFGIMEATDHVLE